MTSQNCFTIVVVKCTMNIKSSTIFHSGQTTHSTNQDLAPVEWTGWQMAACTTG